MVSLADGGGDTEPAASIEPDDVEVEDKDAEAAVDDVEAVIAPLPTVTLRQGLVPDELSPTTFVESLVNLVIDSTPVT